MMCLRQAHKKQVVKDGLCQSSLPLRFGPLVKEGDRMLFSDQLTWMKGAEEEEQEGCVSLCVAGKEAEIISGP